ncbi:MAG: ADP-ribosylglycohydrolase family protein, partial [Candidatus Aenigmatarchaeota archaeon]
MNIKSKFQGSILGAALGDSIGRASEGGGGVEIHKLRDRISKQNILRYTDDTQQMIGLAEAISEKGEFDQDLFAENLAKNFEPSRGYGPGSTQVIRAVKRGEGWKKTAGKLFGGSGSFGNGASMRIAPIGL